MMDDYTMALADVLRDARAVPVIRVSDSVAALDLLGRVAAAGLPAAELTEIGRAHV